MFAPCSRQASALLVAVAQTSAPAHLHTASLRLQARLEPIDLASFEPPTGRRFALRQLDLMQSKGLSKQAAYAQVGRSGGSGVAAQGCSTMRARRPAGARDGLGPRCDAGRVVHGACVAGRLAAGLRSWPAQAQQRVRARGAASQRGACSMRAGVAAPSIPVLRCDLQTEREFAAQRKQAEAVSGSARQSVIDQIQVGGWVVGGWMGVAQNSRLPSLGSQA